MERVYQNAQMASSIFTNFIKNIGILIWPRKLVKIAFQIAYNAQVQSKKFYFNKFLPFKLMFGLRT